MEVGEEYIDVVDNDQLYIYVRRGTFDKNSERHLEFRVK